MKRINISYNGTAYSISDREIAELQQEISLAISSGEPRWLKVNEGEGVPRPALLLIHSGINLVLSAVPEPQLSQKHINPLPPPPPAR
jgi:hypothetical protein